MAYHAHHAAGHAGSGQPRQSPQQARRALAPVLGLAAVGLGIVAAPAAYADSAPLAAGTSVPASSPAVAPRPTFTIPVYPMVGTPFDILSNGVRIPMGDSELSTIPLTESLGRGIPVGNLPVLRDLF